MDVYAIMKTFSISKKILSHADRKSVGCDDGG